MYVHARVVCARVRARARAPARARARAPAPARSLRKSRQSNSQRSVTFCLYDLTISHILAVRIVVY